MFIHFDVSVYEICDRKKAVTAQKDKMGFWLVLGCRCSEWLANLMQPLLST